MRGKLGDKARLNHVVEAIVEIQKYLNGVDFELFSANSMMRFACIKQMEIIGEASRHLTDELKHKYQDIPWQQIVGLRNIFVHEYFGIDIEILWNIATEDIPPLFNKLKVILDSFDDDK